MAWERKFNGATLPISYQAYHTFIVDHKANKNLFSIGDLMLMLILGKQLTLLSFLICFMLFLGDLYIAGVVSAPSEDELFTDLLKGDAGSADGLQILGVVTDIGSVNEDRKARGLSALRKTDASRATQVKKFYDYTRWKLGAKGKLHLLPDMFHFEHLLCKVKRVLEKGPDLYRGFADFEQNLKDKIARDKARKQKKKRNQPQ